MNDYSVSEEKLSAYLDNQLATEDRADVISALKQDIQLSQRLTELQELKEWVRMAYQDPPQPQTEIKPGRAASNKHLQALAASVLILLGGLSGWLLHTPDPDLSGPGFYELSQADSAVAGKHKVLIHISKMDKDRIIMALDKAEQILRSSKQQDEPLQLEVVANAQGLALLRDGSPFGKRIESISKQYDNVAFLACGIAMQNARLSEGIDEVKLLPQAQRIDAALEQILRRLKAGWAYIRG